MDDRKLSLLSELNEELVSLGQQTAEYQRRLSLNQGKLSRFSNSAMLREARDVAIDAEKKKQELKSLATFSSDTEKLIEELMTRVRRMTLQITEELM